MNRTMLALLVALGLLCAALVSWPVPASAAGHPNNSSFADSLVHGNATSYADIKDYYLFQAEGIGAATWGEDIPNPFNHLTDEQRTNLQTQKIDIKRLQKMRAVVLTGSCNSPQSILQNWDPNIILVLGRGSYSLNRSHPDNNAFDGIYGTICSVGPIVVTENAVVGYTVLGADIVWFQGHSGDDIFSDRVNTLHRALWGSPVLFDVGPQDRPFKDAKEITGSRSFSFFGLYEGQRAPSSPQAVPPNLLSADTNKIIFQKMPILDLKATILKAAGTEATTFGQPIANPFAKLAAEGKTTLKARGVDPAALASMRAILISGQYTKANSRTFINKDPNVVLVFGQGFVTDSPIYSLGPILAMGDANLGGGTVGANLVWYTGTTCLPLPGGSGAHSNDRYGHPALVTPDLDALFQKFVVNQTDAHDATSLGSSCPNPFGNLTEEGKAKLKARGLDPASLTRMRAIVLTGDHLKRSFVNHDPNLIMVLDNNFSTGGGIFSLGPILVIGNASYRFYAISTNVVWFVGTSTTGQCNTTYGKPIISSPPAWGACDMLDSADIWHGDYGWRSIIGP